LANVHADCKLKPGTVIIKRTVNASGGSVEFPAWLQARPSDRDDLLVCASLRPRAGQPLRSEATKGKSGSPPAAARISMHCAGQAKYLHESSRFTFSGPEVVPRLVRKFAN
jgi:hypothetical protein